MRARARARIHLCRGSSAPADVRCDCCLAACAQVLHLGAQNALLLEEVQRTKAAREEAVRSAEALLSAHRETMAASYEELRGKVQRDAAEIFERVQGAVSAEVAANVSARMGRVALEVRAIRVTAPRRGSPLRDERQLQRASIWCAV
jgi:hypothetical protein